MATIFQTTYTQREDIALPGMRAEAYADYRVSTKFARGLVLAGYGVFKVPGAHGGSGSTFVESPGQCFHQPSPSMAVDVDAIATTTAGAAAGVTVEGTGLNGVVGGRAMQPPRRITLTLNSHADWDAGQATVTGYSALTGQLVSENLVVPNGGNTTLTTTTYFSMVTKVVFDDASFADGGTPAVNTSFTVGISAMSSLTVADFLGVVERQPLKQGVFASNLYNLNGMPSNAEGNFIDGEMVDFGTKGAYWVVTEEAVSDQDPIYVRVAAGSGGSMLGAFRNDDDSSTCVLVPGRFTRSCAAGVAPAFIQLLG